ncbi:MAG: glycosyltransferase family 4 protein [Chloroflexi bacterium]|nr:glycosyltransferase family 4 protein [Chloroflexota bacterium]
MEQPVRHIALLTGEYPPQPGGVGDYTWHLAGALGRTGWRTTVLTGAGPAAPGVCRLPLAGWGPTAWRVLRAALAALQPDILHIQYQTGAYQMRPLVNLLPWLLRRRLPVAVTAHDVLVPYLFPRAGALREWVNRRLFGDAVLTIATNQADAQTLRAWHPEPARVACIPIGSNIAVASDARARGSAYRTTLGLADDAALVGFFGLISRTKGLIELLDALARLPATAHLVVIGGASPNEDDQQFAAAVRRHAERLGLTSRLHITGHLPPADVSAWLLACDLIALPFSDGASFRRGSLLAALTHGTPLVTTGAGGIAAPDGRVLRDGHEVALVPPGDAAALAAALERLLADRPTAACIGSAGQAFSQAFGWDAIATQHIERYRQIVGATSRH